MYIKELLAKVTDLPQGPAREFFGAYLPLREMVYTSLEKVPEDRLDYKPEDSKEVHALRECFAELPRVEKSLILGLQTGTRKMGSGKDILTPNPTKDEILSVCEKTDLELFNIVTKDSFEPLKKIAYINSSGEELKKIPAIFMLWGLRNHENLHLGMIRRDLDAIGVAPPDSYIKYWYG